MEFSYTKRKCDVGTIYVPTLPINLNGFPVGHALIDTGADITILPIEVNQVLNVTLDPENAIDLSNAGGGKFKAIPAKTKITYLLEQSGFRPITWKGKVFFAPRQPMILLGQYQCLDQLILTMDSRRHILNVELK